MKWPSLLHHVHDVHQWATGICEHDPLVDGSTDSDGTQLQYFSQEEGKEEGEEEGIVEEDVVEEEGGVIQKILAVLWAFLLPQKLILTACHKFFSLI